MNAQQNKNLWFSIAAVVLLVLGFWFLLKPNASEVVSAASPENQNIERIEALTETSRVAEYVKQRHQLPPYYLTKNQAKRQGWVPAQGNLCEVLPGKAIGGDIFGNRERKLPKGKKYYEADVNYHCGNRGADRLIFTKQGEVWLSTDHYRSFRKL